MLHVPTQLICAGLEDPGAGAIRSCSLFCLDLFELLSHLGCWDRLFGGEGEGDGCVIGEAVRGVWEMIENVGEGRWTEGVDEGSFKSGERAGVKAGD